MRDYVADLHIHTALSPCAVPEMTPVAIVDRALELGLHLIAICDHNTAANAPAVIEAARSRLGVIPGMEITTAEEVHVVGLFPDAGAALDLSRRIRERMPDVEIGIASTGLALETAVLWIHEHHGLAVAAHVDRRAFGVIGQLGFLPAEVRFDALEISAAGLARGKAAEHAGHGLPLVSSSDSHSLDEMGASATTLVAAEPTFLELARALRGEGGRRVRLA